MNKLVRFLMMFGPMIFRQYQKYQNKKQREQATRSRLPQQRGSQNQNNQRQYGGEEPRDGRYYKSPNTPQQPRRRAPEPKKPTPISEDEKNFKMKEEEFMLDPQTESEYQREIQDITDIESTSSKDLELPADREPAPDKHNPIERADDDSGFSIRDLFIKPEEDEEKDA